MRPNTEGALENSIKLDAEGVRCESTESLRQKNEAACLKVGIFNLRINTQKFLEPLIM